MPGVAPALFPDAARYLGLSLIFCGVAEYRDEIFTRTGEVVNAAGRFLAGSLSSATQGTVAFIAQFLLFLYTLFFLLLLTLIVTLYDRYEPYHGVRFETARRSGRRLGRHAES